MNDRNAVRNWRQELGIYCDKIIVLLRKWYGLIVSVYCNLKSNHQKKKNKCNRYTKRRKNAIIWTAQLKPEKSEKVEEKLRQTGELMENSTKCGSY